MRNPLAIIPLMLRAHRPSRLHDMKAVAMPFWIRKGYDGLTFFGHIITHTPEEAEAFNAHCDACDVSRNDSTFALKNHEMIHLYQARSTHDSWLCFYWLYFVYWLRACRYRKHLKNAGYRLNPFEMEAYAHMNEQDYTDKNPEGCTEWRTYAKMSLAERYRKVKKAGSVRRK